MKGDFSRETFDPAKHYAAVLMQQGRVQTDADWNEQQRITRRRAELGTRDVIGGCGAPAENAGFAIAVSGDTLRIGAGRMYVDGVLVENETADLDFAKQPDLAGDGKWASGLPAKTTLAMAYLDVWERHVTWLDDPLLHEVALGEADTATRAKMVWQVKVQALTPVGTETPRCDDPFKEWADLSADRVVRMNAHTVAAPPVDGPCVVAPTAGYRRLENQLYRVEVHASGDQGSATFKFSRENGSIVTRIDPTTVSGADVTVEDLGRDAAVGFASGQWVELTDDAHELGERPGQLVQASVDPETRIVTCSANVIVGANGIDLTKNPKLRRWDQVTKTGDIAMTGGWQALEDGVEVQFPAGSYRTGDYWLVPAREATGEIEWPPFATPNTAPVAQPRRGPYHHYCKLALLRYDATAKVWKVLADCRNVFPPLTQKLDAVHVTDVFTGRKTQVDNDATVSLADLASGLVIRLDRPIERQTVAGEPTVFVTVDVPFPVAALGTFGVRAGGPSRRRAGATVAGAGAGASAGATVAGASGTVADTGVLTVAPAMVTATAVGPTATVPGATVIDDSPLVVLNAPPIDAVAIVDTTGQVGTFPLKLAARVGVDGPLVVWQPGAFAMGWLQTLLVELARVKLPGLLAHLTLKGNFIYAAGRPGVYVDGDTFADRYAKQLGARLPSGDGVRGGDLELWFWIEARAEVTIVRAAGTRRTTAGTRRTTAGTRRRTAATRARTRAAGSRRPPPARARSGPKPGGARSKRAQPRRTR